MRFFFICFSLFIIEGCSHNQYQTQQDTTENLLKALYDGDTVKVKQLVSNKVDNGIDPLLFNFYIQKSHDLLSKYGLPGKDVFNVVVLKNDPNLVEFDVPVLNEQQKEMATIQVFFAKFLPEDQVYFFRIDNRPYDNKVIEAPKGK